jgi:hypothetical protein
MELHMLDFAFVGLEQGSCVLCVYLLPLSYPSLLLPESIVLSLNPHN